MLHTYITIYLLLCAALLFFSNLFKVVIELID